MNRINHFHLFATIVAVLLFTACNNGKEHIKIQTLDDIRNAHIGVLMGSTHDQWVSEHYPNATISRFESETDIYVALDNGKIDAAVYDEQRHLIRYATSEKYRVIGTNFNEQLGVVFSSDNKELRNQFNEFLASIRADGTYDRVYSKWFQDYPNADIPQFDNVPTGKPIRVGITGNADGFAIIRNGRAAGFDVELLELFGQHIGRPMEYSYATLGGLIASITSGKSDIIASGITITEERKKQMLFSDSHCDSRAITFVVADEATAQKGETSASVKDGSDLPTAKVGAMTGTTGEMFIEQNYPNANIFSFDDINDAIAALRANKVDYVITAYTTALIASHRNPDMKLLPEKYIEEPAVVAISKSNPELPAQISEVLDRFQANGTLDEVISHWVNEPIQDYTIVDVPKATEGEPIRVAVAANREPMCFVRNNKITGLDIELMNRIAYELGRPVEYIDMKFSALINALESNYADAIISNYSMTKERAKRVNFSRPYFTNPQILLTNKSAEDMLIQDETGWFAKIQESFYSNLIQESRWKLILEGLKATLIITLFAIILGTIIGCVICAMRMNRNKVVQGFAKAYITIMRGTPILVLLMIFFYVVFASTGMNAVTVAIITFALNMAAYSSEIFRTSIEAIDPGQREAGIAMGFTKVKTFIYIILPQAVRKAVPVYKGEAISLLKTTSIVGYIAVVDLTKASDIIRSRTFDAFFPLIVTAVIYFMLAWLLGLCLDYVNHKVSKGQ